MYSIYICLACSCWELLSLITAATSTFPTHLTAFYFTTSTAENHGVCVCVRACVCVCVCVNGNEAVVICFWPEGGTRTNIRKSWQATTTPPSNTAVTIISANCSLRQLDEVDVFDYNTLSVNVPVVTTALRKLVHFGASQCFSLFLVFMQS